MAGLWGSLLAHFVLVGLFSVISIGMGPSDIVLLYALTIPVPLAVAAAWRFMDVTRGRARGWTPFVVASASTFLGMLSGILSVAAWISPDHLLSFRLAAIGVSMLMALTFHLLFGFVLRKRYGSA